MEESAFNSSQRRLCPDGSCVGLLDSDGRCRVCGTQGDAGAPAGAASASPPAAEAGDDFVDADADADTDTADTDTDDAAAEKSAAAGATGSGFKADRRLCDDGSCVGVIGASGVCSVCGQRAAG
jgi:hypothetical protein